MLNPSIFFSVIWIFQLAGYLFYFKSFGKYENETFLVLLIGCSGFLLGCRLASSSKSQICFKKSCKWLDLLVLPSSKKIAYFTFFFNWIFLIVLSVVTFLLLKIISASTNESIESFRQIRDLINTDFAGERVFYDIFRIYQVGIVAILFLFCCGREFSKKMLLCLFLLGLASALLTTSRLYLLFYVLSAIGIFSTFKLLDTKQVALSLIGFLIFFFTLSVLMKKGYENLDQPFQILLWNIQVYLFSPLAAFNSFIKSGLPNFYSSVMIPNIIKKGLNLFGFTLEYRTNLMPFVDVPVRTNVYTFFFPLYHDGGKILVACGTFLIGFTHQSLFCLSKNVPSPITVYLFAISLYPLAMSFFEDAYFSSPGFLGIQLSPIICLVLLNLRSFRNSVKAISL